MNILYVIQALRRSKQRKAERVMFDRLEYEFHQDHNRDDDRYDALPAGGAWADDMPDPSDDTDGDRGECAA